MKKFVCCLLPVIMILLSCSKPVESTQGQNAVPPGGTTSTIGTNYLIDWDFSAQSRCWVTDSISPWDYSIDSTFRLIANSNAAIGTQIFNLKAVASQVHHYPVQNNSDYSVAAFIIYGTDPSIDQIIFKPLPSTLNFFTASFINNQATFSGTCSIYSGTGVFKNIGNGAAPLNFIFIANPTASTGSIKLTGTIVL